MTSIHCAAGCGEIIGDWQPPDNNPNMQYPGDGAQGTLCYTCYLKTLPPAPDPLPAPPKQPLPPSLQ